MQFKEEILGKIEKLDKKYLLEKFPNPTFKRNTKKEDIVHHALKCIKNNRIIIEQLYKENLHIYAVHPSKAEELLGITKTQRNRFREEGKLKVVYSETIKLHNNYVDIQYFDLKQIIQLVNNPAKIEKWEAAHKEKIRKNRERGTQKAKQTKDTRTKLRAQHRRELNQMITDWSKTGLQEAAYLELAFWTVWVSRWAKEYQLKSFNGTYKNKEIHAERKNYFYSLKNDAIEALIKSPYTKCSFYQPEEPHKITHLNFCDFHYEHWCMERKVFSDLSKWEYYGMNSSYINSCPDCTMHLEKDYYSLYVLDITVPEIKDVSFNFHTPYSLGKRFLPSKDHLPQKNILPSKMECFDLAGLLREMRRFYLPKQQLLRISIMLLISSNYTSKKSRGCPYQWDLYFFLQILNTAI